MKFTILVLQKIKVKYYKPEEYMNFKKKFVLLIFKSLD
jgi:hypothetical protein